MTALPQQEIMLEWLLSHPEAYLAVDAGLGKSRSVLEAISFWKSDCACKGALIIAPKWVASLSWPVEIERWSNLTVANLRTPAGLAAWDRGSADIYLVNFEYLQQFAKRCLAKRKKIPVDVMVVDEISKAKSHESVRIKALLPYRRFFKRFIGLSGTPTPNSCLDLWGQMRLLDGGWRLGDSFHRFRSKYAESDHMGYKWTVTPGSDEMIRAKVKDVMLVLRSQDYMDIPPVTFEDVPVTLPAEALRQYRVMQKKFLTEIEGKEVVSQTAAVLVQKLMQFSSGAVYHGETEEDKGVAVLHDAKVQALGKLHDSIHRKPMLVFTHFRHETNRILKAIPYAQVFDGKNLDAFNAGKIPMLLAHPASLGHGVQCQHICHHVAWFTLGYSSELYVQGCARVARTGQKNPTRIFRLLSDAPIDHAVADVLRVKEAGQSSLKAALSVIHNLKVLSTS